jgi:hypothetical protein
MTLPTSHNTACPAVASEVAYALRNLLEALEMDTSPQERFQAINRANGALQAYAQFDRSF